MFKIRLLTVKLCDYDFLLQIIYTNFEIYIYFEFNFFHLKSIFNAFSCCLLITLFGCVHLYSQTGHIIWQDEFNTLNTEVWNIDLGDACAEDLCGRGNQELQSYQKENTYIEDIPGEPGNYALVLEARRENSGNR